MPVPRRRPTLDRWLAYPYRNLARAGHPSRVTVSLATPEGQRSGLLTDSVIVTDNLATVLESEIDRAIGAWTNLPAIGVALRHPLGL